MLTFKYTAYRNDNGETVSAQVQADSPASAAKLLSAQGLFPVSIENVETAGLAGKLGLNSRVSAKDKVIFTRQLSTLINAGLPLSQSLRTVQDQISNDRLKTVIASVLSSVEAGTALSKAFSEHPKIFNHIYISLVAAGEASGSLDKALARIADQQEKDAAIVSKIRSALTYPVIVLVIILAVLIFMLTTVLPQVGQLFTDLRQTLPLPTQILLAMSNFIINFWWLVLIIVGGGTYALILWIRTASGRSVIDQIKLQAPVFGRLYRKVYMARFARTLGTLMNSGVPVLEGLRIVHDSIGNVHVEAALNRAIDGVRGGKALSGMLVDESSFLPLVGQMIRIGEQSGAIDQMLEKVAVYYEDEVDEEVTNLSTTIEPILMVVLGLIVGGVILAVLLPVYSLVGSGAITTTH
jgi:type IV pilus assembly protein PilC